MLYTFGKALNNIWICLCSLFQIGRAYSLTYDFQSAAAYYEQAYAVINSRMSMCAIGIIKFTFPALLTEKLATADVDKKTEIDDEIKELHSLLPDIHDKIKDAHESAKAAAAKAIAELSTPAPTQHDATTKSVAVDITELVRKPIKVGYNSVSNWDCGFSVIRKRPGGESGGCDDEAKRTKTDMTEVGETIEVRII